METNEIIETVEYTIDNLNSKGVSIKKQVYYNGQPILPHRTSYENTADGRKKLLNEIPEQYANIILAFWGDTPIDDPIEEIINENNSDTQADNEDENNDNQNTENETTHQE